MNNSADVLIIGGGLIGGLLMLALDQLGYSSLLLEAKPLLADTDVRCDGRSLALSPASVKILTMLGVWAYIQQDVVAIENIHVSEQGVFGQAKLHGSQQSPLGYVVDMRILSASVFKHLDARRILAPSKLIAFDQQTGIAKIEYADSFVNIKTQIMVAADGADSSVRQLLGLQAVVKDYHQSAIVTNIGLTRSHHNIAYERFTTSGALALLPIAGMCSALVWSLPSSLAKQTMCLSDESFLRSLQDTFGYRLGKLKTVGSRNMFALRQVVMDKQIFERVVFIGNAAHTLHPVAGQGFNLGLRDVAMLVQHIASHGFDTRKLVSYQQSRREDQQAMLTFTNSLIELFGCKLPGLTLARGAGLILLDNSRFLKKILSRYARGYAGIVSDLVCGIPLQIKGSQDEASC